MYLLNPKSVEQVNNFTFYSLIICLSMLFNYSTYVCNVRNVNLLVHTLV
jgi:hypothetical protein